MRNALARFDRVAWERRRRARPSTPAAAARREAVRHHARRVHQPQLGSSRARGADAPDRDRDVPAHRHRGVDRVAPGARRRLRGAAPRRARLHADGRRRRRRTPCRQPRRRVLRGVRTVRRRGAGRDRTVRHAARVVMAGRRRGARSGGYPRWAARAHRLRLRRAVRPYGRAHLLAWRTAARSSCLRTRSTATRRGAYASAASASTGWRAFPNPKRCTRSRRRGSVHGSPRCASRFTPARATSLSLTGLTHPARATRSCTDGQSDSIAIRRAGLAAAPDPVRRRVHERRRLRRGTRADLVGRLGLRGSRGGAAEPRRLHRARPHRRVGLHHARRGSDLARLLQRVQPPRHEVPRRRAGERSRAQGLHVPVPRMGVRAATGR